VVRASRTTGPDFRPSEAKNDAFRIPSNLQSRGSYGNSPFSAPLPPVGESLPADGLQWPRTATTFVWPSTGPAPEARSAISYGSGCLGKKRLYYTEAGQEIGFQARPVVGGVFMKVLMDAPTWKKWSGKAHVR